MKSLLIAITILGSANPAHAQLGKIMRGIDKAQQVKQDLDVSEKDERALGEAVSQRVRSEFGVFQNREVTRYVTLVGTVMTQGSSRPDLNWEFIVLDTDGVNAFASPGGIVHVTRGALGLISSEAELAGVLAHEIAHVTRKHTINSIRNNKGFRMAGDAVPGSREYIGALVNAAYENIVEKGFDRGDEEDADREGVRLANTAGYNPSGLGTFLAKLAARNTGVATRNALFASHPETEGRIARLERQIKSEKLAAHARAESRYSAAITFEARPITEIALVADGARGVAEGSSKTAKTDDTKAQDGTRKKGFGLGNLKLSSGKQAESTQASASAGNRAVGVDRHAKGGSNPAKVSVTVTPEEVQAFKKGMAA